MKFLVILGRILFALPFMVSGALIFMKADAMAKIFLKGWPLAEGLVYVAGLAMILAGISISINIKARLACLLLGLLLLIFILGLHLPLILDKEKIDFAMSNPAVSNLLKDSALLGAALTYAGILKK